MYEVEFKVELTEGEREALLIALKAHNFPFVKVTPQNDYYIQADKSPFADGYDLKRYRDEGEKYIYTEKIWEMIDGLAVRKEIEHAVSKEEFTTAIAKAPQATKIKKDRHWFAGQSNSTKISITVDSVKFDHSPTMRYFIEAEVDIEDKAQVKATHAMIKEFLKELLDKPEVIEAPGMFTMAFEKR
ncbi:CYTH domain-containing protein [Candidatus Nomurabacteria bacterium]|nr:CYTH domain-containing protein [Candidatus Nomurabacteria bacterium]